MFAAELNEDGMAALGGEESAGLGGDGVHAADEEGTLKATVVMAVR